MPPPTFNINIHNILHWALYVDVRKAKKGKGKINVWIKLQNQDVNGRI